MKTSLNILQRVLVNHFYRVNTGFFLFCFFVLFGVVSGGQLISYHLSLIHGMISSPVFLGCVILLWIFYTVKCINQVTQQINRPKQNFLFALNTFPQAKQFSCMLFVHLMVYLPVLIYALIVLIIAIQQHRWGSAFAVIGSNIIMVVGSAWIYLLHLQKKITGMPSFSFTLFSFPKPFFSIPLWFMMKERKQMLFVTKIFSFLLIYVFINLYEPDAPDIRPLLLIIMLVAAAHSAIILQVRSFEENFLLFSKNLPIPIYNRFLSLLLMYLLLLLPELVFTWKGFPLHFQLHDLPQVVLLTVMLPVFFHSLLYMNSIEPANYYRLVSGICAFLFFVLLYNLGMAVGIILLPVTYAIFHSHLYDFEKKIDSTVD